MWDATLVRNGQGRQFLRSCMYHAIDFASQQVYTQSLSHDSFEILDVVHANRTIMSYYGTLVFLHVSDGPLAYLVGCTISATHSLLVGLIGA